MHYIVDTDILQTGVVHCMRRLPNGKPQGFRDGEGPHRCKPLYRLWKLLIVFLPQSELSGVEQDAFR